MTKKGKEMALQSAKELTEIHEEINLNNIYKKLNKMIIKIENSIKNDIQVRKEAVFLPYKASMWDSLESVWLEKKANPEYDTYVICIPYYDRNVDGSFREMHYEENQFPINVPITRYDESDFGIHHPDEIYIHNPYDDCNLVTSIHPFFYCKNLLEVTNKLVYYPYFILAEPDINNEKTLEEIAHFMTVPAMALAHQVVVQLENMRQAYIKVLTKHYGEQSRRVWKEKILGKVSPKIDKVR